VNTDALFRALEAVGRDLRYALRSFRRTPLVALTIVTTVALGLGLVAVVFTLLNLMIFRADAVRNPHELFAVERQRSANAEPERFTRAQYDALVRETDVFADTFANTPEIDVWIDGQRMEGPLVSGNFFQLLGVSAERGRTLAPSDDEPGASPAIVLSHRAWSLRFAADPNILTRSVLLNGAQVRVVGVMPESFRGLTVFPPDYWAPLSLVDQVLPVQQSREGAGLAIVGRLKPGMSRDQALARLVVWDSRRDATPRGRGEGPPRSLVLEPRQGTVPLTSDVAVMFTPLFFAFGLILVIGWANVANLLLARAVARQREIGIRLAVGASRRRIIMQLLTESLVLSLVSAALAFGISRLVLNGTIYAVTSTWDSGFGDLRIAVPPADWRIAAFLVAGAMVSTVFFALAPAIRATRLELVRAMRGEVARDARPSRARNTLVTLQVTGSALLLICAGVFLRSAWAAAAFDPGFNTADTINVNVLNEQKRQTILDVVRQEPSIVSVAASWPGVLGGRPAFAEGPGGKIGATYQFVSPEFFRVFDIDLVRGRGFAETEQSANAAVAVVSERVANELWPGVDAVGQAVRIEPDPRIGPQNPNDPPVLARTFTVVGLARDVPGFRLGGQGVAGAGVYVPISADVSNTLLTLRARVDSLRSRQALVDRLAAIDPNMAEVTALRTMMRIATYVLGIPFWLTLVLGVLALLLTLSGLFSVLSYLVEQRTREIGVRMALGATSRGIAALVLKQSARPVGIGLLLGVTLTLGLGAALLATPAAEFIGSIVRVFDPIAYVASLLCIIAACACASVIPVLRAVRVDPVAALRQY
jgi:predicted permease